MKQGSSWAPGDAWLEGKLSGLKTLDKPAMIHTYNPNISVGEALKQTLKANLGYPASMKLTWPTTEDPVSNAWKPNNGKCHSIFMPQICCVMHHIFLRATSIYGFLMSEYYFYILFFLCIKWGVFCVCLTGLLFCDRILLLFLSWPEADNPPAPGSDVLRLQVCITTWIKFSFDVVVVVNPIEFSPKQRTLLIFLTSSKSLSKKRCSLFLKLT